MNDIWKALVACPGCGLASPNLGDPEGRCRRCGLGFELRDHVLTWHQRGGTAARRTLAARTLARRAASALHPLNNPLLPMRHLTTIRRECYYRRTLSERRLAEAWGDHFLSGLDIPQDAVALDFGCGRGRSVALLDQLGFRVAGQDIQPHPWWSRLSRAAFQVVPPDARLPWRTGTFDLVVEVNVIHYMSSALLAAHAAEVRRCLRPGGFWLLLEGNDAGLGAAHLRKQIGRLHPLSDIRRLAADQGFTERDHDYVGYYARRWPLVVNFVRGQCSLRPFDAFDWDSTAAARLTPERRGQWLLRLQKTGD